MGKQQPFLSLPDVRDNLLEEFIIGQSSGSDEIDTVNGLVGPKTGTTRVAGGLFPNLDFQTAGDTIFIPQTSALQLGQIAFTFVLWMKVDTLDVSLLSGVSHYDAFNLGARLIGGKRTYYIKIFDSYYEYDDSFYGTTDVIPQNEWFMFSATLNLVTGLLNVYVNTDKVLSDQETQAGMRFTSGSWQQLGKYATRQLDGQLALLRVYKDKWLSADEIRRVYEHTRRFVLGMPAKK